MKFPPFAYRAPGSAEEAVEILASDPEAKVLAGGQSLLPLLALRIAQPSRSSMSAASQSCRSSRVAMACSDRCVHHAFRSSRTPGWCPRRAPLLAQAIRKVAHRPIRNRATIGGSLAHADPAAELPAVALALDATLIARGPSGERRIDAADFFTGAFTTALRDDEILTSVEFPVRNGNWAFVEIGATFR